MQGLGSNMPCEMLGHIFSFLSIKEIVQNKRVCKFFYTAVKAEEKRLLKEFEFVDFQLAYWAKRILENKNLLLDCQAQKSLREKSIKELEEKEEKNNYFPAIISWAKEYFYKEEENLLKVKKKNLADLKKELADLNAQELALSEKQNELEIKQRSKQEENVKTATQNTFYSFVGGEDEFDKLPELILESNLQKFTPQSMPNSIMRGSYRERTTFNVKSIFLKSPLSENKIRITWVAYNHFFINELTTIYEKDPSDDSGFKYPIKERESLVSVERYDELKQAIEEKIKDIRAKERGEQ